MLLFVCHASEDQNDFVRPLAEALRKKYDVWYSEFVLTLGDSLRQKIDDGLTRCDFGVVVLSKAFFDKKWPQAELDGLFALETKSRKIILPIWKGVTEDDVKKYSPLLAGKIAVSASAGLPKVVEEIRLAVNVSERKRELTALDAAAQRVKALEQTLAEKQHSEKLLQTPDGARLVLQSFQAISNTIEKTLSTATQDSHVLRFGFSKPRYDVIYVRADRGMHLGLRISQIYDNSASNAVLEAKIFKSHLNDFGQPTSDPTYLQSVDFKPRFRTADRVGWITADKRFEYGTDEIAAYLVDLFREEIEKEFKSRT
jgi:hypothetical protein